MNNEKDFDYSPVSASTPLSDNTVFVNDVQIATQHRNCPLCNADSTTQPVSPYSSPPWIVRQCSVCEFVYIDSAPEYRHLVDDLDWDTTFAAETERKAKKRKISYRLSQMTRWRLHLLPKRGVAGSVLKYHSQGRIIDLGCGGGGLTKDLFGQFEPYGIEISAKLARQADTLFRQYGGRVENAPCLAGLQRFPDHYFEAAVARSYFEHEAQPLAVMKETFRVLKPHGVLVVKVPNYTSINRLVMGAKWPGFRYPDHLNYFTPRTLEKMATTCGFTVKFGLLGRLPTNDNMWATLIKPC